MDKKKKPYNVTVSSVSILKCSLKQERNEPLTNEAGDRDGEDSDVNIPLPPPQSANEEWVDYVDALGYFSKMDQELQNNRYIYSYLYDMRREMQREHWEREEEEQMKKPVGPIHYENIRDQEARELGAGYFAFTTEQRHKHEQLKEAHMNSKNDEDDDEGLVGPPLPATVRKVEVVIQERKDIKPGVPHVREWDRGKEFSWGQWTSRRREERDSEFAPPSTYYPDDRKANHNRAIDKGQSKGNLAFKWSESQKSTDGDTDNISTIRQPSDIPTYAQPAQTQSLDDLLSYYKHST
uniref:Coiled-coil domain containing 174 n=1 Tax=Cyprinus carpio TaxID=7962 RepID=A0A8C1LDQ0_CYPCA